MADDAIRVAKLDAEALNKDTGAAKLDRTSLDAAIRAQGLAFEKSISVGHEHLFADVPVFISSVQLRKMHEVISAVEQVVGFAGWSPHLNPLPLTVEEANEKRNLHSLGVFYGYDFHLNEQGVHLIEINTNAGGAFLNAMLIDSQRDVDLPGKAVALENLEQSFPVMFRNEWQLERGSAPLKTVAIVDEQPEAQYLYPEFLLAQRNLKLDENVVYIADPAALLAGEEGLYLEGSRVDLVYNRLTDFSLQRHSALLQAYLSGNVVLTPSPAHYARYAYKRNLARLSDADGLRKLGASEADIVVLQGGVPHTIAVRPDMEAELWEKRKELFFKPNTGYGSKGAYRGDKLTKRVFGEILQGDYVAQKLAAPGERMVSVEGGEAQSLKYDVRCYVYDGQVQLVAARLYQGQTTNFRTPGGGFAPVRVVDQ